MSAHTPGPWLVMRGKSYLDETTQWLVSGVAHCGDAECSEANARLIAAAPELLAALTELLDARKRGHITEDSWRFASAALAKAKGE